MSFCVIVCFQVLRRPNIGLGCLKPVVIGKHKYISVYLSVVCTGLPFAV